MATRTQRAFAVVDLDRHARSHGFSSAAERMALTELHARLGAGQGVTNADVRSLQRFYPRAAPETLHRYASYVMQGGNPRARQDRLVEMWARSVGVSDEGWIRAICEQAHVESAELTRQDGAAELTTQMNARDAHVDRQRGIDQQARAEAAKRAALTNPANVRRSDVEAAFHQHYPEPVHYAHQRRELQAQRHERNVERLREQAVRDSDPSRDPGRGDDRRDDIRLNYDMHVDDQTTADELALAANPELERVDNALTHMTGE